MLKLHLFLILFFPGTLRASRLINIHSCTSLKLMTLHLSLSVSHKSSNATSNCLWICYLTNIALHWTLLIFLTLNFRWWALKPMEELWLFGRRNWIHMLLSTSLQPLASFLSCSTILPINYQFTSPFTSLLLAVMLTSPMLLLTLLIY